MKEYKGWLTSESFVKRSLAAFGYSMMGYFIIIGGVTLVAIVIGVIIGLGSL